MDHGRGDAPAARRQAAIKGADGVFYWDLNRKPEITPGGVMPTKTEYVSNMRQAYDTWYKTMQEQDAVLAENNPDDGLAPPKDGGGDPGGDKPLPWDKHDPIIDKDNEAMLNVPLSSKLAFQRMINVFSVLATTRRLRTLSL